MRVFAALFTLVVVQAQGVPPRASAADYLTHAKAGNVTIAAEFLGHAIPTDESILQTDEYVGVETAFYGPPNSKLVLSLTDFSLRINGKKSAIPADHYEMIFKSLRDPELEPTAAEKKEKTNAISSGGSDKSQGDNVPPPKYHPPIAVQRGWEQNVQKAALAESERPLPVAGLIFFLYRGKRESIHSLELIYNGPAGKLTLPLQP